MSAAALKIQILALVGVMLYLELRSDRRVVAVKTLPEVHMKVGRISVNVSGMPVGGLVAEDNTDTGSGRSEVKIQKQGPWFLGTCAMTKGSGDWLREWVELQILSGVDHVWIVDDNRLRSGDATSAILSYYVDLGYVTIIPGKVPRETPGCEALDSNAYEHVCAPVKHCFRAAAPHVKWLMYTDTDEFVYTHSGCSLSTYIKNTCNPDATHIRVWWERFGTSGHNVHPHGLVTENFLTSGGTCFCPGAFNFCPPCRKTKVIYNTECVGVEHAGWPYDLVNTTEWKKGGDKRVKKNVAWIASDGQGSNFKKDVCTYSTMKNEEDRCNEWAKTEKGYNGDCCGAGIGLNHYGAMSTIAMLNKHDEHTAEVKRSLGGGSKPDKIDLNWFISVSILRYLNSLKKRMTQLGISTSENTNIVESDAGTCFIEANRKYVRHSATRLDRFHIRMSDTAFPTVSDCCAQCHGQAQCRGFTFLGTTCTLLIATNRTGLFPYQLEAFSSVRVKFQSGVPIRDAKC